MINEFYVYAHYRTDSGTCFYIGKGKNNRLNSTYKRNLYWKRVSSKGYQSIILFDGLEESKALELEIELIRKYNPSTNLTAGGNGGNTYLKISKDNMKKIVSEKQKKRWAEMPMEIKKTILKSAHYSIKRMWANMDIELKSNEQRRRSLLRPRKQVRCLNNNTIYNDARAAAKALNIKCISKISAVCLGNRPHTHGYAFEYITKNNLKGTL